MAEVYWIRLSSQHDVFSEGYVGYTSRTAADRFKEHLYSKNKDDTLLCRYLRKHALDIVVETLCVAVEEYCLEVERLLRPSRNIGWNNAVGGGLPPDNTGKPRSEVAKNSTAEKHRGMKRSEATCKKISEAMKGLPHLQENILKAIEYNRGKPRPDHVKAKISESNKNRVVSEATVERMRTAARVRVRTQEEIDLLGKARAAYSNTPYWLRVDADKYAASVADEIYEMFSAGKRMCEVVKTFTISRSTVKKFYIRFEEGWNPVLDANWRQWKSDRELENA